jgi:hypothetical protein
MDGFREVKEWQRISIVTYVNVKTVMPFATMRRSLIYRTSLTSFSEFINDARKFRSQFFTPAGCHESQYINHILQRPLGLHFTYWRL